MIAALNDFYRLSQRVTERFQRAGGAPPSCGGKGTRSTPYGGGTFGEIFCKVTGRTLATDFGNGSDFGGVPEVSFG